MIYFIGDSHVNVFKTLEDKNPSDYYIRWIGAATARGLTKTATATKSRELVISCLNNGCFNKENDIAVICFGEIDCRMHIYSRSVRKKKDLSETINETVNAYNSFIQELISQGFNIVVLGIPPANHQLNVFGIPHYADDRTRSRIYQEFNQALKKLSSKFIDVQSFSSTVDGFIKPAFDKDNCHLTEMIIPFVLNSIKEITNAR